MNSDINVVIMSIDWGVISFYLNGQLDQQLIFSSELSNNVQSNNYLGGFVGSIYEVIYYGDSVTENEVVELTADLSRKWMLKAYSNFGERNPNIQVKEQIAINSKISKKKSQSNIIAGFIVAVITLLLVATVALGCCITRQEVNPPTNSNPSPNIIRQDGSPNQQRPPPIVIEQQTSSNNLASSSNFPNADIPIPSEDLRVIGWVGGVSRDEAEQKLGGFPNGTFLTRWSGNTNSYVISYSVEMSVVHLAFIRPRQGGGIVVELQNGRTSEFNTLLEYINKQREEIPELGEAITVLGEPVYHNVRQVKEDD